MKRVLISNTKSPLLKSFMDQYIFFIFGFILYVILSLYNGGIIKHHNFIFCLDYFSNSCLFLLSFNDLFELLHKIKLEAKKKLFYKNILLNVQSTAKV